MSETPTTPTDRLISAGTPCDSPAIQALETLSIGGLAVAIGGAFLAWPITAIAVVVTTGSVALTIRSRKKRILENEAEARHARYRFFKDREKTVDGLTVPDDVKSAIKNLVTDKALTRFEVATKLKISIGEARANQYLPVVLLQADRTLEIKPRQDGTSGPAPDH